jgi:IS5 family transposase
MKQTELGLDLSAKRTRKREFLDEMHRVVPWDRLTALIEPHYGAKGKASGVGRPPFALQTMLRIHFLQQWFALSDPAMEEALFDVPLFRQFAQLPSGVARLPDESTVLRFRHLLEKHDLATQILAAVNDTLRAKGLLLKAGTVVDATLIAAPSSTKNSTGERDPEMHQTKKGNQWYFGMKAHIGADRDCGLVHTVVGTAANVADVKVGHALLHGNEEHVFADAGYQGAAKRPEATSHAQWHVAMKAGERKRWKKVPRIGRLIEYAEKLKASVRAKVEHPFRLIKLQFGYRKVRYRGLVKNTAQLHTLFALSNLWMARGKLLAMAA